MLRPLRLDFRLLFWILGVWSFLGSVLAAATTSIFKNVAVPAAALPNPFSLNNIIITHFPSIAHSGSVSTSTTAAPSTTGTTSNSSSASHGATSASTSNPTLSSQSVGTSASPIFSTSTNNSASTSQSSSSSTNLSHTSMTSLPSTSDTTQLPTSTDATQSSGSASSTVIRTSSSTKHRLSAGDVAGITVGLTSAAVLLIVAFLLRRRRQKRVQKAALMNPLQIRRMGGMDQPTSTQEPFAYPVPHHPQPDMTSTHIRGKVPLPGPTSSTESPSGSGTAALREEIEELRVEMERLRDAEMRRAEADQLRDEALLQAGVLSARSPPSESLPEYVDDRSRMTEDGVSEN